MDENIGIGWGFPPRFNKVENSVGMVSGMEEIEVSLNILFSTKINERLFHPDFGCNLDEYQFKGSNQTQSTRICRLVRECIETYEKRIKVEKVEVHTRKIEKGILDIEISYSLPSSGNMQQMSYPYTFDI